MIGEWQKMKLLDEKEVFLSPGTLIREYMSHGIDCAEPNQTAVYNSGMAHVKGVVPKLLLAINKLYNYQTYGVTIRSNRLDETIRTNGHTIGFG